MVSVGDVSLSVLGLLSQGKKSVSLILVWLTRIAWPKQEPARPGNLVGREEIKISICQGHCPVIL